MRTRITTLFSSALALMLLFLVGCSTGPELTPAPSVQDVPALEDAAISNIDGLEVIVQPGEWTGDPEVQTYMKPARVQISNQSGVPIRIRYRDFALIDMQGERYTALTPFEIEGNLTDPVAVDYAAITDPEFDHANFAVAPVYGPVYPALPAHTGPFYFEPDYYKNYAVVWDETELPTARMLAVALPEGVLGDEGFLTGYLYFEPLTDVDRRVRFTFDVINDDTGEMMGRISIPFLTEAAM